MADEPSGTSDAEEPGDVYPVLPPNPDHVNRKPPSPSTDINEVFSAAEKEESRFQFSIAEMLLLVATGQGPCYEKSRREHRI